MKFACPKCNTRYSIADEKVPAGKIVKFPCKSCQHVIRLRRKDPTESAAPLVAPEGMHETTRVASLTELDKLRASSAEEAAPAQVGVSPFGEGLHETTKVASAAEMHALRSALTAPEEELAPAPMDPSEGVTVAGGSVAPTAAAPARVTSGSSEASPFSGRTVVDAPRVQVAPPPAEESPEWYVLIAGKQQGPVPRSNVLAMLQRREIDKRTFVWRGSMANWERLGTVEAFKEEAEQAGDAAWRVVKPAAPPVTKTATPKAAFEEPTTAMSAEVLQEQLKRAAAEAGAGAVTAVAAVTAEASGGGERFAKAQTVVTSDPRVQAAVQEVREQIARSAAEQGGPFDAVTQREPTFAGEPLHEDEPTIATSEGPSDPGLFAFPPEPGSEPSSTAGTDEPQDSAPRSTNTFAGPTPTPVATEDTLTKLQAGDLDALKSFDDAFTGESMSPLSPGPSQTSAPGPTAETSGEVNQAYLQAPPGEATKVFMATAGLYKRRRQNRIAAVIGVTCAVVLVSIVAMDVLGFIEIPGMGIVYEVTGFSDPNTTRALQRTESKLADSELDPKRRAELEALRRKLLGAGPDTKKVAKVAKPDGKDAAPADPGASQGVVENKTLDQSQRSLAEAIMQDSRKQDADVKLQDPSTIQTPNLPEGLTQDAIFKVIQDNNNSMKLCFAEAARKGEKLAGKMEVQLTIDASGAVAEADINTAQFKTSTMGSCTVKRVRSWKFPRFNGEPVTVVFPYVLQMGM